MARSSAGAGPAGRRALAVLALALLSPGAAAAKGDDRDRALEIQVKAEFVERFTRFVEWPAAALPEDAPFVVCALGSGGLATRLGEVMARGGPGGRTVRVLRPAGDAGLEGCHLLYVPQAERGRVDEVVRRVRERPVLTVGDTPGFAEHGVIINLYVDDDGFVRFEVNRDAALASGLKLSARLLSLARLVPARE